MFNDKDNQGLDSRWSKKRLQRVGRSSCKAQRGTRWIKPGCFWNWRRFCRGSIYNAEVKTKYELSTKATDYNVPICPEEIVEQGLIQEIDWKSRLRLQVYKDPGRAGFALGSLHHFGIRATSFNWMRGERTCCIRLDLDSYVESFGMKKDGEQDCS